MKNPVSAVLLTAIVLACTAVAAAAPSPGPINAHSAAAAHASASSFFDMLQRGSVERSELAASVNSELTEVVLQGMAAKLGPLGKPVKFEQMQTGTHEGSTYYAYRVTFKSGDMLDYVFAVDADGKVSGFKLSAVQ